MANLERVFGLSINEEIQWGTALADLETGVLVDGYESGVLCQVPEGKLPHNPEDVFSLENSIQKGLTVLKKSRPEIFHETVRVGISSIGIINRQKRLLVNIARKGWLTKWSPDSHTHIVDFKKLFLVGKGFSKDFSRIINIDQIIAQNDAPARCLTEYVYGFDQKSRPDSLFYLMAGEGVNGAVVFSGDFPAMIGHPEFGHCTPQLHPRDKAFSKNHSGCPAHHLCFEGLVSSARFRKEWGKDLWNLPINHHAWDIAAWYLAQMAMTGTLMLHPSKIICGGELFNGEKGLVLLSKVRECFFQLNAGYLPHFNTKNSVEELIDRAFFGRRIWAMSAVTMASSPGHARSKPEDRNHLNSLPISPNLPAAKIARNADRLRLVHSSDLLPNNRPNSDK